MHHLFRIKRVEGGLLLKRLPIDEELGGLGGVVGDEHQRASAPEVALTRAKGISELVKRTLDISVGAHQPIPPFPNRTFPTTRHDSGHTIRPMTTS